MDLYQWRYDKKFENLFLKGQITTLIILFPHKHDPPIAILDFFTSIFRIYKIQQKNKLINLYEKMNTHNLTRSDICNYLKIDQTYGL